jgi:hypothetical protein
LAHADLDRELKYTRYLSPEELVALAVRQGAEKGSPGPLTSQPCGWSTSWIPSPWPGSPVYSPTLLPTAH